MTTYELEPSTEPKTSTSSIHETIRRERELASTLGSQAIFSDLLHTKLNNLQAKPLDTSVNPLEVFDAAETTNAVD